MAPIIKYFEYGHLPEHLQQVSKPIGQLAVQLDHSLPDGPEKSAGLRKLLEAKDCFVRAALDQPAAGKGAEDVVTRYRLDVMDPGGDAGWVMHRYLPDGTAAEQARDSFHQTADDIDLRVRLVECREKPIAMATAKV